ncbi:MAG: ATP-binding protein, partial [Rhodothermales bacterium]
FEKTSIYRAEMGHKRKDGSTFMSSTAFASLRDSDGQVIGAVGICRDITEQKQYEAELLAAKDRAEELSRLKTAFLTNMSHEIRTPLTGILGFAKVLEEELPDEQREFAHLIRISGDRLLNTLNSILDLARLEAGEMTISPHDLDVVDEVEEAATVFHAVARKKQIQFAVNYHLAKMPARIDRNILNIILNNLVGNAIKFTDEGHVRVDLDATEDVIFLSVSDTGVGIDSKFLPHLFDEFKQESDGLTRSYEGSGLGLSITRRLVHLVNGEINVESAKGKGSRFAVTIPRYIDLPSLSNVA